MSQKFDTSAFFSGKKLSVSLKVSDYLLHRKEQNFFLVEAIAQIPAENSRPPQSLYKEGDISLNLPELEIKVGMI